MEDGKTPEEQMRDQLKKLSDAALKYVDTSALFAGVAKFLDTEPATLGTMTDGLKELVRRFKENDRLPPWSSETGPILNAWVTTQQAQVRAARDQLSTLLVEFSNLKDAIKEAEGI